MAEEDLDAAERKTLMREKFEMNTQMEEAPVEYHAQGGVSGGGSLPPEVQAKMAQAQQQGASPQQIQSVLKNNAMKARNARVRGALVGGGLQSLGKTSENMAGLTTQAGLQNKTFTPTPNLGGVAQGIKEAGHAEAKYQDELSRIDESQQARSDKLGGTRDEMLAVMWKANPHITHDTPVEDINAMLTKEKQEVKAIQDELYSKDKKIETEDVDLSTPQVVNKADGGVIYRAEGGYINGQTIKSDWGKDGIIKKANGQTQYVPNMKQWKLDNAVGGTSSATTNNQSSTPTPIVQFVDAVEESHPEKIVVTKKVYDLRIPSEFDNLSSATPGIKNLIYTYELYSTGNITEREWKNYLNNVWLKNKQADPQTSYWRDTGDNELYYAVEENGQKNFYHYITHEPLTQVKGKLVKEGTGASGGSPVGQEPNNLIAPDVAAKLERALEDARTAIHAGAGDVIKLINEKSTSNEFLVQLGAIAVAAPGDASFAEFKELLQSRQIFIQDPRYIDAYFGFMHAVSQFEVIASQTSGEARLTDEDAKRYLKSLCQS